MVTINIGDKVRLADTREAKAHAEMVGFPITEEVGMVTALILGDTALVEYPSLPHRNFVGEGWATLADHLVKVN